MYLTAQLLIDCDRKWPIACIEIKYSTRVYHELLRLNLKIKLNVSNVTKQFNKHDPLFWEHILLLSKTIHVKRHNFALQKSKMIITVLIKWRAINFIAFAKSEYRMVWPVYKQYLLKYALSKTDWNKYLQIHLSISVL